MPSFRRETLGSWLTEAGERIYQKNIHKVGLHVLVMLLLEELEPLQKCPAMFLLALEQYDPILRLVGREPYTLIGVGNIERRNEYWQIALRDIERFRELIRKDGRRCRDGRVEIRSVIGDLDYLRKESDPFGEALKPIVPGPLSGHW